jgi:hypothetical protein
MNKEKPLGIKEASVKQGKTLLKDQDQLLKCCSIALKILFAQLDNPGKMLKVTPKFLEEDLYPFCGFLRKNLREYQKLTGGKNMSEVGPAIKHLKNAEKHAYNNLKLQKSGSRRGIDPIAQLKAEGDSLFECREEIENALEYLEEFC